MNIKNIFIILIVVFIWTCSSSCSNPTEPIAPSLPQYVVPAEPLYANYNVPSHDWENYQAPWFDWLEIYTSLGFDELYHNNTGTAYADFNGDNFIDIVYQDALGMNQPLKNLFFINNGDNTFTVDRDFPISSNDYVLQARKTIVGDFNLDDKPDVVRPQGGHDLLGVPYIILSDENGYTQKFIDAPEQQYHTISSGDIDNDGDLDLFFAQGGEQDGFAINDGNGNFSWKWISERITDFDDGYMYPGGGYGYYGFWTSDMTDVDNDGFIDLILAGSYKDEDYDSMFEGPTVLWGDGSGYYTVANSITLFDERKLTYLKASHSLVTHDISVNDIDGDGFKDIALQSGLDETNSSSIYQVVMSTGNRTFEDKTEQVMNNYIVNTPGHVWIILRDINNDGNMDLVEGEPTVDQNGPNRKSSWWIWTGSSFVKVQ